jgi:Amt family ammonium transporter
MMVSSALVFFMIPGLCLHFSGISRPQSTLTLVRLPLITTAVVGCVVSAIEQKPTASS